MRQISPENIYHNNFALMCLAEGITPVADSIVSMDEKLAALASPDGFSSLVLGAGGIKVELDPNDHQASAERIMRLLDVLDGYSSQFIIDIKDNEATLLPKEV